MIVLDAQAVADTFPLDGTQGGAQMFPAYRSNGGYFNVVGNPVYIQLAYSAIPSGGQGETHWTPPVPFPVGPGILAPGTVGIRFRNYTAGKVATVSGALAEHTEPPVIVTSAGTSTPTVSATILTGVINSDASIAGGTGFSVVHTGTGIYTVTFTAAFTATPTVQVTMLDTLAGQWQGNFMSQLSNTGFVARFKSNAGAATDVAWTFLATAVQ